MRRHVVDNRQIERERKKSQMQKTIQSIEIGYSIDRFGQKLPLLPFEGQSIWYLITKIENIDPVRTNILNNQHKHTRTYQVHFARPITIVLRISFEATWIRFNSIQSQKPRIIGQRDDSQSATRFNYNWPFKINRDGQRWRNREFCQKTHSHLVFFHIHEKYVHFELKFRFFFQVEI